MTERVLTLHPEGKEGVNVSLEKYEAVREAILTVVDERGEVGFRELVDTVRGRLAGDFHGSVSWYATTVKLDLEARGELVRTMVDGAQRLRRG